jgi:hypothetical protein
LLPIDKAWRGDSLAIGASSNEAPKMLLPYMGEWTVLGHLLAVWSTLAHQAAVVIAKNDAPITRETGSSRFRPGTDHQSKRSAACSVR